jgi:hypothetical protein
MKKQNVILLTLCLFILIFIVLCLSCNKLENFTPNQCYATELACLADCVQVYTFTPNSTNKWVFYNGSIDDSAPPTLSFTRYPNNVVEVKSSAINTANNCKGGGFLYFSLIDGVWKQKTTSLTIPPAFISSLTVDKPANGWNPSTRNTLKVTSEFPIIITENIRKLCVAGIGKFIPENGTEGSASPLFDTCCPSLFFYIATVGEVGNPWLSAGNGTNFTIPPFVGRYQSGGA